MPNYLDGIPSSSRMEKALGYNDSVTCSWFDREIYSDQVMHRIETMSLPFILGNSKFMRDVPFNQTVRYYVPPTAMLREYEDNQTIKHVQTEDTWIDIRLGDKIYFSEKFSEDDWMKRGSKGMFQSAIKDSFALQADNYFFTKLICYLIANAFCKNVGNNAGAHGNINLGSEANPFELISGGESDNIRAYMNSLQRVMAEQGISPYLNTNASSLLGRLEFVLVVPPTFWESIQNSTYIDQLLLGNCPKACDILNGQFMPTAFGWSMVVSNCMPVVYDSETGEEKFPIVGLIPGAYGTAFSSIRNRIVDTTGRNGDPDELSFYYQLFMTYGWHLFQPKGIIVGWVKKSVQ